MINWMKIYHFHQLLVMLVQSVPRIFQDMKTVYKKLIKYLNQNENENENNLNLNEKQDETHLNRNIPLYFITDIHMNHEPLNGIIELNDGIVAINGDIVTVVEFLHIS